MTDSPISSIAAMSPNQAASAPGVVTTASSLANQDVFLQLLIAQLKNQDPSKPMDGTTFVTQLAQFTTLQENTKATTDLDLLVAAIPKPPVTPTQ